VSTGLIDVVPPTAFEAGSGGVIDFADDTGGKAEDHGIGGNLHSLSQDRAGADDRAGPDMDAVEQDRTHADQAVVLDRASMKNHAMTGGDPRTDRARQTRIGMNHGQVLNIRCFAYGDPLDIAAKDGVVPDARIFTEMNVSQHDGAAGDEGGWIDHGKALASRFNRGDGSDYGRPLGSWRPVV
jgi:hypothetical protein